MVQLKGFSEETRANFKLILPKFQNSKNIWESDDFFLRKLHHDSQRFQTGEYSKESNMNFLDLNFLSNHSEHQRIYNEIFQRYCSFESQISAPKYEIFNS